MRSGQFAKATRVYTFGDYVELPTHRVGVVIEVHHNLREPYRVEGKDGHKLDYCGEALKPITFSEWKAGK